MTGQASIQEAPGRAIKNDWQVAFKGQIMEKVQRKRKSPISMLLPQALLFQETNDVAARATMCPTVRFLALRLQMYSGALKIDQRKIHC